jgi:hypothetical protein
MSQVSQFPAFLPGLGTLYVQPGTVPFGPYYGYDRQGRLIDTVYLIPLRMLDVHAAQNLLKGSLAPVDHVDFHYTNGHPGVSEPHYHIILWHISPVEAAKVE